MSHHPRVYRHVLEYATTLLNLRREDAEKMSLEELMELLDLHATEIRAVEKRQQVEARAIAQGIVTADDLGRMSPLERLDIVRALRLIEDLRSEESPPLTPRRAEPPPASGATWPSELVLAIAKLVEIAARQQEMIGLMRGELAALQSRVPDALARDAAAPARTAAEEVEPDRVGLSSQFSPLGRRAVSEIESIASYVTALSGSKNVDLVDLHERLEEMARADRGARTFEYRRGLPRVG